MIHASRFRIYCIDDDADVRISIERLLDSAGYKAETFSSARSFLDSVPADSQGLLLLDLRMPDMDGFKLQIKLKDLSYHLKTIIITAHAEAGDREYLLEHGAYGFLMKPFDDESLLDLIHKAMEKDKGGE